MEECVRNIVHLSNIPQDNFFFRNASFKWIRGREPGRKSSREGRKRKEGVRRAEREGAIK